MTWVVNKCRGGEKKHKQSKKVGEEKRSVKRGVESYSNSRSVLKNSSASGRKKKEKEKAIVVGGLTRK